jgi:acetyltransferase-like isoleucine patch superfamily enzyme
MPHPIALLLQPLYLSWRLRRQGCRIGMFSLCENVTMGRYNVINKFVRLKDVSLGDMTYVANGARIVSAQIGKFCSIGPDVRIGLGIHPSRVVVSTHPAFYSKSGGAAISFSADGPFTTPLVVTIEHDVWIGQGAIVMDGVRVGTGAVIGAGAVVTKDVAPFEVVAGVPARVIRRRFDTEEARILLDSCWWDRDVEWLRLNVGAFKSIATFKALALQQRDDGRN